MGGMVAIDQALVICSGASGTQLVDWKIWYWHCPDSSRLSGMNSPGKEKGDDKKRKIGYRPILGV
jgi:hypothetical protein